MSIVDNFWYQQGVKQSVSGKVEKEGLDVIAEKVKTIIDRGVDIKKNVEQIITASVSPRGTIDQHRELYKNLKMALLEEGYVLELDLFEGDKKEAQIEKKEFLQFLVPLIEAAIPAIEGTGLAEAAVPALEGAVTQVVSPKEEEKTEGVSFMAGPEWAGYREEHGLGGMGEPGLPCPRCNKPMQKPKEPSTSSTMIREWECPGCGEVKYAEKKVAYNATDITNLGTRLHSEGISPEELKKFKDWMWSVLPKEVIDKIEKELGQLREPGMEKEQEMY